MRRASVRRIVYHPIVCRETTAFPTVRSFFWLVYHPIVCRETTASHAGMDVGAGVYHPIVCRETTANAIPTTSPS